MRAIRIVQAFGDYPLEVVRAHGRIQLNQRHGRLPGIHSAATSKAGSAVNTRSRECLTVLHSLTVDFNTAPAIGAVICHNIRYLQRDVPR